MWDIKLSAFHYSQVMASPCAQAARSAATGSANTHRQHLIKALEAFCDTDGTTWYVCCSNINNETALIYLREEMRHIKLCIFHFSQSISQELAHQPPRTGWFWECFGRVPHLDVNKIQTGAIDFLQKLQVKWTSQIQVLFWIIRFVTTSLFNFASKKYNTPQ